MKRDLPAYVYVRKGGLLYFERRAQKSQRIKSTPGTPAFALEYAKLRNGALRPEPTRRSFRALVKSYRAGDRFRKLAPRIRADYDKVLAWGVEKLGHLPANKMQRKDVIRARDVKGARPLRESNRELPRGARNGPRRMVCPCGPCAGVQACPRAGLRACIRREGRYKAPSFRSHANRRRLSWTGRGRIGPTYEMRPTDWSPHVSL